MTEPNDETTKSKRGFAALSPEQRKVNASRAGKAAHANGRAHRFTPEEARAAGQKGGKLISQDREHMAEIGKKGGKVLSADREHMAAIGRKGGSKVAQDRDHMAELGKLGAASRHGRTSDSSSEP